MTTENFLAQFDDDAPVPTQGFQNELAKLANGFTLFKVESVETKPTSTNGPNNTKEYGEMIILNCVTLDAGKDEKQNPKSPNAAGIQFVQKYWVTNPTNRDRFAGDLELMGFDPAEWSGKKNNRPFSKELPKALKAMKGMILHGDKTSSARDKGDVGHYLNIKGRGADGKPAKYDAKLLNEAVADAFS